tara:strand:- start:624 stop:899 length:276 start_codon:yes stop_codon:yes gene_type:complete
MVVDTKFGEFECKDITRKERREFYKKVKMAFTSQDLNQLHSLQDEFTVLAFEDDDKAEDALKGLTAVQEDEVLTAIIGAYMGLDLGNLTGD